MKFSDKLIQKTIEIFEEKHNHKISKETANEYLDSFSDLFLTFSDKE